MATKEEAEAVESTGTASGDSTKAILGGNFILSVLIAGPLDQIWSLMNSLQVVMFVRLFNIKSPGNVNGFTDYFDEITSVKILDAEALLEDGFYVPEMDAFALNFQNGGFDSHLFLINASPMLLNFTLHFSMVLFLCLLPLLARWIPRLKTKV